MSGQDQKKGGGFSSDKGDDKGGQKQSKNKPDVESALAKAAKAA